MTKHVDVVVFAPLYKRFTYAWPERLGKVEEAIRVLVPFGRGLRTGIVLAETDAKHQMEVKEVADRLDERPLYDADYRRWMKRALAYYLAPEGRFWQVALAWAAEEGKRRWRCKDLLALQKCDVHLAEAFGEKKVLSASNLARRMKGPSPMYRIQLAANAGALEEEIRELEAVGGPISPRPLVRLTPEQENALAALRAAEGFRPFLLFGRTGSGKTEVYLRIAMEKIRQGKQVLILVPEIGLTPQWLFRVAERTEKVAVWHSGIGSDRLAVRQHLDDVHVIVGTRSAIFLPLPRLGLIVVDEEHDASFKQQDGVLYHARDLAVLLAQEKNIPVILGSATPSLESWRLAKEGRYTLLRLKNAISPHASPSRSVVDMRGCHRPLSEKLLAKLRDRWEKGEQSLLYLNRRGYAPQIICSACGWVPTCPRCDLRLVLHRKRRVLRCHACGFLRRAVLGCEACGEEALIPLGAGTERVEEQLSEELPGFRFARLDRDSVRSERHLTQLLSRFAAGKLDCLIGTQMVIKGHHFPNVTLVGVVNADLGLSLPDFRAGERWWQQLTQVIGRTGRGDKPGEVVIQTRNPESPWLSRVGDAQAEDVLEEELRIRKSLAYPPYARWVRILLAGKDEMRVGKQAESLCEAFASLKGLQVVGPIPAAIEKIAGRYRIEILLRDESRRRLPWRIAPLVASRLPIPGVRCRVDVDPVEMM